MHALRTSMSMSKEGRKEGCDDDNDNKREDRILRIEARQQSCGLDTYLAKHEIHSASSTMQSRWLQGTKGRGQVSERATE
mmetsp:Transcript_27851/g.60513  ORF Transcript_27851/g.60513 Transcript_27851/m.60513 type:complete len:80 (-) Transcript_27851:131-370(-)